MSSTLNGAQHPNYGSGENEHEYYEEEWVMTKTTKRWLTVGGVAFGAFMLYVFCFVLPLMFIPKLVPLADIVHVKDLSVSLRPVSPEVVKTWGLSSMANVDEEDGEGEISELDYGSKFHTPKSSGHTDRLVLVGDIHGQQKELHRLLKKIKFNSKRDVLIVLGDFVAKGPRSLEVIDDLIALGARCILGNHEYYALQNYAMFHGLKEPQFANAARSVNDVFSNGFNTDPEFLMAKKLEPHHIQYINLCPLMLKLGRVPLHSPKNDGTKHFGLGLAVHAGLRWDLTEDLNQQTPLDCLEMRAYIGPHYNETSDDLKTENAVSWSKIWNGKHNNGTQPDDYVIYYGHDAHRGLNLKRWAKGLDSGCTRGDSLTAMVLWQEQTKKGHVVYKEQPVSVKC